MGLARMAFYQIHTKPRAGRIVADYLPNGLFRQLVGGRGFLLREG